MLYWLAGLQVSRVLPYHIVVLAQARTQVVTRPEGPDLMLRIGLGFWILAFARMTGVVVMRLCA
jgi:hypothetical protein